MLIAKSERVAGHFKANPIDNRSDRTIAAELGVGKDTVRRARTSTGSHAPVEDEDRPTIDRPPRGELWDDQNDRPNDRGPAEGGRTSGKHRNSPLVPLGKCSGERYRIGRSSH